MRARTLPLFLLGTSSLVLALVPSACGTDNGSGGAYGPSYTLDSGAAQGGGEGGPSGTDSGGGGGTDSGGGGGGTDSGSGGGTDSGAKDGGTDAGSCTGVLAVVSGGATTAFGSIYAQGAWKTSALTTSVSGNPGADNPAGQSVPAIVPLGSDFLAVVRTATNALSSTRWSAGAATWSTPAAIGAATARDTPSLATLSGNAHLVYQAPVTYKFFHGTYTAGGTNAWDTASDPVGGAGVLQSFGPTTPGLASVGTELVAEYAGDGTLDAGASGLWDLRYSGAAWVTPPTLHPSPLAYFRANPAIAALPAGGTLDAVVVYSDQSTNRLQWTGRKAADKSYTTTAQVDVNAISFVGLSLAALPSGKLALVFWGTDQKSYYSLGTVTGASVAWTAPTALVAGTNPVLTSPPAVTAGVCGDDAVATYVTGGSAYATRLRGSAWTAPEALPMVTGALAAAPAAH